MSGKILVILIASLFMIILGSTACTLEAETVSSNGTAIFTPTLQTETVPTLPASTPTATPSPTMSPTNTPTSTSTTTATKLSTSTPTPEAVPITGEQREELLAKLPNLWILENGVPIQVNANELTFTEKDGVIRGFNPNGAQIMYAYDDLFPGLTVFTITDRYEGRWIDITLASGSNEHEGFKERFNVNSCRNKTYPIDGSAPYCTFSEPALIVFDPEIRIVVPYEGFVTDETAFNLWLDLGNRADEVEKTPESGAQAMENAAVRMASIFMNLDSGNTTPSDIREMIDNGETVLVPVPGSDIMWNLDQGMIFAYTSTDRIVGSACANPCSIKVNEEGELVIIVSNSTYLNIGTPDVGGALGLRLYIVVGDLLEKEGYGLFPDSVLTLGGVMTQMRIDHTEENVLYLSTLDYFPLPEDYLD